MEPAYGGQEVGAEGEVGASAALQDQEHLGEGVGDQVVGVRGPCDLAREAPGGVHVASEQLSVGVDVAAPDGRDQLGVAGAVKARQRDTHTNSNAPDRLL